MTITKITHIGLAALLSTATITSVQDSNAMSPETAANVLCHSLGNSRIPVTCQVDSRASTIYVTMDSNVHFDRTKDPYQVCRDLTAPSATAGILPGWTMVLSDWDASVLARCNFE
jgi:hypothetical protein